MYGSYGDDSPYASSAPSIRHAGNDPFKRIYGDQMSAQREIISEIGRSKAAMKAAKYGAAPTDPYTRQSFGDDFVSRLASQSPQLASGLVSGLRGLFGGSSSGSFSSNIPWDFNTGLNFLPSGSSGTSTNFSDAGISGPDFAPTTLDFFR